MKNPIGNLNKLFDHRIRLGIMSALVVNESVDFITLRDLLQVTDGNIASHLKTLEESGTLTVTKEFVGKKPKTSYSITDMGRQLFHEHLKALESILNQGLGMK